MSRKASKLTIDIILQYRREAALKNLSEGWGKVNVTLQLTLDNKTAENGDPTQANKYLLLC